MKTVYLAGPIAGCNDREANKWRDAATISLEEFNIRGISPLRCEPIAENGRYDVGSPDPRFGTGRAIASKNFLDVQMCDITLCYMPKDLNERRFSMGTLIELAWAKALTKPTILVTDYDLLLRHPVVDACAGWVVPTLDDGLDICVGVLGDYA